MASAVQKHEVCLLIVRYQILSASFLALCLLAFHKVVPVVRRTAVLVLKATFLLTNGSVIAYKLDKFTRSQSLYYVGEIFVSVSISQVWPTTPHWESILEELDLKALAKAMFDPYLVQGWLLAQAVMENLELALK